MKAIEVRRALRGYYKPAEYGLAFEVAAATGAGTNRHLDAVAMSLWPSRGLTLTGIEIKVDRRDWRRERDNPAKAEEVAKYLDFFVVCAPVSTVPLTELPAAWGLLEVSDKGICRIAKQPTRTEAKPPDRNFLAALLRASCRPVSPGEVDDVMAVERDKLQREYAHRVATEVDIRMQHSNTEAAAWRQLVAACGFDPGKFYQDKALVAAVATLVTSGLFETYRGIAALRSTLRTALTQLETAEGAFGKVDHGEPVLMPRRRKRA